jgi:hypothetical protein
LRKKYKTMTSMATSQFDSPCRTDLSLAKSWWSSETRQRCRCVPVSTGSYLPTSGRSPTPVACPWEPPQFQSKKPNPACDSSSIFSWMDLNDILCATLTHKNPKKYSTSLTDLLNENLRCIDSIPIL